MLAPCRNALPIEDLFSRDARVFLNRYTFNAAASARASVSVTFGPITNPSQSRPGSDNVPAAIVDSDGIVLLASSLGSFSAIFSTQNSGSELSLSSYVANTTNVTLSVKLSATQSGIKLLKASIHQPPRLCVLKGYYGSVYALVHEVPCSPVKTHLIYSLSGHRPPLPFLLEPIRKSSTAASKVDRVQQFAVHWRHLNYIRHFRRCAVSFFLWRRISCRQPYAAYHMLCYGVHEPACCRIVCCNCRSNFR